MDVNKTKYIFVIGGVMSGVGKGIASASIGKILEDRGYSVGILKIDPYLNVDAGTMNPIEHGETFVLSSGLETDQDLGNYERFLNVNLPEENYITSGMVYSSVINKERNLEYDGRCVEAIPHIRNEIVERIEYTASKNKYDICVIEIGGTIGDYQNIMFIEAARVMAANRNNDDVMFVMLSYLPIPNKIGEMKTKPTQNAVRQLNGYGIQPNIIIGRSTQKIDNLRKEKIAIQCNIKKDCVISAPDVESIYDVPFNFEEDGLTDIILNYLNLEGVNQENKPNTQLINKWNEFTEKIKIETERVKIAVVGKYFGTGDFVLSDVYISVIEAIKFAGVGNNVHVDLEWVSSQAIENGHIPVEKLNEYDGILVPGGFGSTGINGKIDVIRYARENKIPYFGLCYGMQLMVIEYARNVLGLKDADTLEINPNSKNLVITIMEDQKEKIKNNKYGGTMRLGDYETALADDTLAKSLYKKNSVIERHRHRYEVNSDYISDLENAGLIFSGKSPDGNLMEIAELRKSDHPFMLGTQFHPEFLSRPLNPHPLFIGFIKAAIDHKKNK